MSNIFLVTLAILIGLLWSGVIDAQMKWTATMFGLSLAALMFASGERARPRPRREREARPKSESG
ncbi:MAG: hypothetical protein QME71_07290 [Dehalococcoidia bacterium]|nr:hypothetical protein [Dehalococcoidia bacterium]